MDINGWIQFAQKLESAGLPVWAVLIVWFGWSLQRSIAGVRSSMEQQIAALKTALESHIRGDEIWRLKADLRRQIQQEIERKRKSGSGDNDLADR